jgi:hypothetical protein
LGTRHSQRPLLGERLMHNSGTSRRGIANAYLKLFGLFEIESRATSTSSRTSERSERDPGPITTNGYVARTWGRSSVYNMHRWLWVPAFRGDDKRLNCFGCLKIESVATSTSSRTSERSEREPGPITTNVRVARGRGRSSVYNMHRWLWAPAFRGDDKRLNCFGCLKIESVQLIEYERAPHSQPSSPATGPAHIAAR